MRSASRILLSLALVFAVGLSACGRRGSLDRPQANYPEVEADPSTKQQKSPDRRIPILDDIIH
ncbi:LPS translocon maturation chaperone LptM [Methyloceanibacter methanicus]|nr:lipoprotein [Methyloceanibacter methanicus]